MQKPNFQELRQKAGKMLDERVRILTAGMSLNELRAVMRGEPPTEKPNPRYKVHTTSFLFHIRPRYYEKASTFFSHTFRLGFFTSFFFFVELLTGLILMIYYIPSPDHAYQSIYKLMSEIPFGQMLRDIHRLGAEAMVIFTALHMLRTYLTGSYKKDRSFTWLTGVILLLTTLLLSFSGYLLPWDQLAYWAVTIGTSMAEAAPLFGNEVNLLLRGAPDISTNGLLRFYLLHVVLMPLVAILVISIHYYKVSREHGISLPAKYEEGLVTPEQKKDGKARIDFIPDLFTHEVFLVSLGIAFLVWATATFYHAPLEHIANPQQTPLDTMAPWYFLWLQGLLKIDPAKIINDLLFAVSGRKLEWLSTILNSKQVMGIVLPTVLFGVLFAVPYIDRNPNRSLFKRPWAVGIGILFTLTLITLSYMGLPGYGIETPAATRIVQDLAPMEGLGPLRSVPFEQLKPGVYEVGKTPTEKLCPEMDFGCPELETVFTDYTEMVDKASEAGKLPDVQALMIIEDWQIDLRKVTLRILWKPADAAEPLSYENHVFLHKDHNRE